MNMNNKICQVKQDILVTLDTRNCTSLYNGNKFSDVEWDLTDVISKPKAVVEFSVSVINGSIPIGQYNVLATDNNGCNLFFTEPATGLSWTTYANEGNYTINTLIDTLKLNLPTHFSWTYMSYLNKIFIYNTNGNEFTMRSTLGLCEPLGLDKGVTYTSTSQSLQFPNCCNMSGLRTINIHMDNLNTKNITSFTKSACTIIASVPIDVNSNGVVSYNLSCDYEIPVPISSLDYINILLKDDLGNSIRNNGIHWNITLKFSYYIEQEFSTETLHEKVNRQKITIIQPKPMITEIPKIFTSRQEVSKI